MEKLNENKIFEKINPLIEQSMSNEQKRETKRLISCALPRKTDKIINLNISFWFFRMFYITIYFGSEKREINRTQTLSKVLQMFKLVFSTFLVFFVVLILLSAIFLALYYIKSLLGIDLFEFHLF